MSPEQALKWLANWGECMRPGSDAERAVAEIEAMVAEPRLPAEPSNLMLIHMDNALQGPVQYDNMRSIYRALYAHLTAPKPMLYRLRCGLIDVRDLEQERALALVATMLPRGPVTIEPEAT